MYNTVLNDLEGTDYLSVIDKVKKRSDKEGKRIIKIMEKYFFKYSRRFKREREREEEVLLRRDLNEDIPLWEEEDEKEKGKKKDGMEMMIEKDNVKEMNIKKNHIIDLVNSLQKEIKNEFKDEEISNDEIYYAASEASERVNNYFKEFDNDKYDNKNNSNHQSEPSENKNNESFSFDSTIK